MQHFDELDEIPTGLDAAPACIATASAEGLLRLAMDKDVVHMSHNP